MGFPLPERDAEATGVIRRSKWSACARSNGSSTSFRPSKIISGANKLDRLSDKLGT